MANNKKSTLKPTKVEKQVSRLDTISRKILTTVDPSYTDRQVLTDQDSRFQKIIADELNFAKGVSKGSIIDFVQAMAANNQSSKHSSGSGEVDATQLFTKDVGDIYGYFQDVYRNRFIEISDLKFITKFIPAIGEAVKTTLDSIVSADDISTSISRTLSFGSALTDEERSRAITEIERIEKEEKLLKRLKNIAYKKALVTGVSYVYHIPYAELFAEYDKRVKEGTINPEATFNNPTIQDSFMNRRDKNPEFNLNSPKRGVRQSKQKTEAQESSEEFFLTGIDISADNLLEAVESFTYLDAKEKATAKKAISSGEFGSFYANDDHIITEALESVADMRYLDNSRSSPYYTSYFGGTGEVQEPVDTEGAIDTNKSVTPSKFNLSGTYIKFIDAKNMIPIKIYNTVVGYYYIHSTASAKKAQKQSTYGARDTSVTTPANTIFNSSNLTEKRREQVINDIVDVVAGGILSSFSTRFVNKYSEHKKLIADCLIANGLINNDYSIQFIPADYVTQFTINEDENGNGESMLLDALFPAKLLLSFVVNKLLTYMNKTGNKTIAYVGKGPIDVGTSNHVQRVVRMLQESNITFNDLLSTNLVFSKFTRDSNIQLPKGRNGEKLIEFEVQEGQNIDMKTDMEDWLEKLAILGTGVPSVIMEYVDSADFSRSLVTANIKHASRVACYQSDLEESTTELYKFLIIGSSLDEDLKKKAVNSFEFKLARPRVLANANTSEFMGTLEQTAELIVNMWMLIDNQGGDDPNLMKIKAQMKKNYILRNAPFIDVDALTEDYEKAQIAVAEEKDMDKKKSGDDTGEGEEEL